MDTTKALTIYEYDPFFAVKMPLPIYAGIGNTDEHEIKIQQVKKIFSVNYHYSAENNVESFSSNPQALEVAKTASKLVREYNVESVKTIHDHSLLIFNTYLIDTITCRHQIIKILMDTDQNYRTKMVNRLFKLLPISTKYKFTSEHVYKVMDILSKEDFSKINFKKSKEHFHNLMKESKAKNEETYFDIACGALFKEQSVPLINGKQFKAG